METRSMARRRNEESQNRDTSDASSSSDDSVTLDYKLHQIFLKYSSNLNVIHLNAQSIPGHYLDFLRTFTSAHSIDAILVSETFLKPDMASIHYGLPGFKLIRNDREGKPSGGVAIYLRQGIPFNYVTRSPATYSKSAEHLFIEIFPGGTKVLLGVYYSPSLTIKYFPSFEGLLNRLRSEYEHVMIMGDFNTCLLKNNKRAQELLRILDSNRLDIPLLDPTHFAPNTKPSLLDLMIVSNLDNVAKHGQLTGCFSYHDILYMSYKVASPKQNLCSNFVMEIIPTNGVTPTSPPTPVLEPMWRTRDVREALARQLKAKRKLKSKRTPSVLIDYQNCRRVVRNLELKLKNTRARMLISRRTVRKTRCFMCEPRSSRTQQ